MANDINIEASVNACGFELYDVCRPKNSNLTQIKIFHSDRPTQIQDCVTVHKHLIHSGIDTPIEVSSPGTQRPLKTHQHFILAQSHNVRIITKDAKLNGKLVDTSNHGIEIQCNTLKHSIAFDDIIKAHTILPNEALS